MHKVWLKDKEPMFLVDLQTLDFDLDWMRLLLVAEDIVALHSLLFCHLRTTFCCKHASDYMYMVENL